MIQKWMQSKIECLVIQNVILSTIWQLGIWIFCTSNWDIKYYDFTRKLQFFFFLRQACKISADEGVLFINLYFLFNTFIFVHLHYEIHHSLFWSQKELQNFTLSWPVFKCTYSTERVYLLVFLHEKNIIIWCYYCKNSCL